MDVSPNLENALPAAVLTLGDGRPGRSRFAGSAALLPSGAEWPTFEGEPLSLMIQVDLAEARVAAPDLAKTLPAKGILQAFVQGDGWHESGPLEGPAPVALRYHPDPELLEERMGPEGTSEARPMSFEPRLTLSEEDLPEDEAEFAEWSQQGHQLLGHPFPIQSDPMESVPDGVVLLLQIASDDELGWMFGDVGILYFMADGAAFAEGRLERAFFEFQCS